MFISTLAVLVTCSGDRASGLLGSTVKRTTSDAPLKGSEAQCTKKCPFSLNFGWKAIDHRPCSTKPVCTSEPSGLMLVRSRNGSGLALPPFTTFTRPTRSTTKMRPEPSFATDTPTGSLNPSATLISETFCAPGIGPPGRATSAGVEGIVWATAATELNTVAAATAASHRAFIACTSPADRRRASPSGHAPGGEAMMGPGSASILGRPDRTWKAGSRDCDDYGRLVASKT